MGIYYFAVDRGRELQINPPGKFCCKEPGIYNPNNPFSHMVIMKNVQGYNFDIVNDVSSYDEHGYKDITEEVYEELKEVWKDYDWEKGKWIDEFIENISNN